MSVSPLDSGSFDKKLQDPWALLLRPSFSCGRNCRTLVQSNLVLLFFDGASQFHYFSINGGCISFSKNSRRNYRTLVQINLVLPFFDKEFKKATQKHTCLFGTLRLWSPWWETARPLGFASSALLFLSEKY